MGLVVQKNSRFLLAFMLIGASALYAAAPAPVSSSAPAVSPMGGSLTGPILVSPAQRRFVQGTTVEAAVGYGRDKAVINTDGGQASKKQAGPTVAVEAVHRVSRSDLWLGLAGGYEKWQIDQGYEETSISFTRMTRLATALGAVAVGDHIVAAMAYTGTRETLGSEAEVTQMSTYGLLRSSALYFCGPIEVGVVYHPYVSLLDHHDHPDTLDVQIPSTFVVHGRWFSGHGATLGGVYEWRRRSRLDSETSTDQHVFLATFQGPLPAEFRAEGTVGYTGAYYKNGTYMSDDNIGTFNAHLGVDRTLTDALSVGGIIKYMRGKDANGDQAIQVDNLLLGARVTVAL